MNSTTTTRTAQRNERPTRARNERPSRPLSAYNYFFRMERERLVAENPMMVKTLGYKGMAKFLGKQWKKTDKDTSALYHAMAAQDKARYVQELLEFNKEQEEFLVEFTAMENAREQNALPKQAPCMQSSSQSSSAQKQVLLCLPHYNPSDCDPAELYQLFVNNNDQNNSEPTAPASTTSGGPCSSSSSSSSGFHSSSDETKMTPIPYQDQTNEPVHLPNATGFDHQESLKNMAREIGNGGIDYLLAVLCPRQDHLF